MKKVKILSEYLAAFILISLLLFAIASTVIVKFYGDEVQEYAMDFVNDHIDTKIAVEEIGISLFRKFPNTSVFLNNVTIWSGHRLDRKEFSGINTDTLLFAERIYVQFNLLDLARKQYNIKGLDVQNGLCKLLIDSRGNSNFSIVKEKKEGENKNKFRLRGVQFKAVDISYLNKAKNIEGGIVIDQVLFEGAFEKDVFDMKTKGSFFIDSINSGGINYIRRQELKNDISLNVRDNYFKISKGSLLLGDISSDISGEFLIDRANGTDLNIQISGNRINLGFISTILEKQHINYGIRGSGTMNLRASITGILAPSLTPHIEAEFSSKNGDIQADILPFRIHHLNFQARYSNGEYNTGSSSSIEIESLTAQIEKSNIDLSFSLKNIDYPQIRGNISGNIDCKDLNKIVPEIPIDILSGTIQPDFRIEGKIGGIKDGKINVTLLPEGQINFSEISLSSSAFNLPAQNLEGTIELTKKSCKVNTAFLLGESCISMQLKSGNILSALNKEGDTHIEGIISGSKLNIDELLENFPKKTTQVKEAESFPKNFSADIDFNFDHIIFGELATKHINGNLRYVYPGIYISPFYLETLNGKINAKIGLFDLNKENYQASLTSVLDNIDISHLFSSFNNFGQEFLTEDNIAGNISGEINFLGSLDQQFKPLTQDIVSESKITISNGELNNFEPMMEMSKFLKINQLDNIQFSNISNTVQIRDNIINIPQMDIISNAFSMNAMGTHNFNKTYDYHLAIKLSDLLFNKAQSSKRREFDIALDKNDQRTIFLMLYDEGDGMLVDFDEKQAMKKIKNDIREEKTELKVILNEEFGVFKNDENIKQQQKPEDQPQFNFEFSDEVSADTIQEKSEKRKWWQKVKKENKKPDFEFVIDSTDI